MEDVQKYLKIDTSKILTDIINSGKFGENFIPEVDGKAMLMEMLPVEQAKASGKGSELYQEVTSAYRTVMENLVMIQQGITPRVITHQSTRKYQEPRGDTFRRREPEPYRGIYGHWKS